MKRRVVGLGLIAAGAASGVLVLAMPAARADAPSQQGWWTAANPGGVPSAPVPAPASPASVPPDVPADGLLVQGGPDGSAVAGAPNGPIAFAAVVYDVADGASVGQLTLKEAPNSATTPSAKLILCPLVNPTLRAEQGGPMSDAPDYNCGTKVAADIASDNTWKFDVASLAKDGSLAVAILPGDATTRVVLSKPDTSSLAVLQGMSSGTSTDVGATTTHQGTASSGGSSTAAGGGDNMPSMPAQDAQPALPQQDDNQAPVVAPTAAQAGTGSSSLNAAPMAASGNPDAASPRSVGLLLAGALVGAGLWAFAGRDPRDGLDLDDA